LLPLRDAIAKLSFHRAETASETYAPISAQTGVQSGQQISSPVTERASVDVHETPVNTGEKSLRDTTGHNTAMVGIRLRRGYGGQDGARCRV
jgi:hypothetical protein